MITTFTNIALVAALFLMIAMEFILESGDLREHGPLGARMKECDDVPTSLRPIKKIHRAHRGVDTSIQIREEAGLPQACCRIPLGIHDESSKQPKCRQDKSQTQPGHMLCGPHIAPLE